ncbi:MAG TPA: UpxY family transcription antiterminator [Spirochaetota bacterium]|nr:UpxY family transcription antiterminator [Spirochaetota bacterium]
MESNWYAVYVRSRHEFKVHNALLAKGIESFLPVVERLRQWKDRKKLIPFPLFPGYLFVKLPDDKVYFLHVLKINGVVKILGDSCGYQPVAEDQIVSIYKMVNSKLAIDEHPYLKEGQKVKIVTGPLSGVQGILQRKGGEQYVVVSIDILQKGVAVKVNIQSIEPVI